MFISLPGIMKVRMGIDILKWTGQWRVICPFCHSLGKWLPLIEIFDECCGFFFNFCHCCCCSYVCLLVCNHQESFYTISWAGPSLAFLNICPPRDPTSLIQQDNLILFFTSTMLVYKGLVIALSQSTIMISGITGIYIRFHNSCKIAVIK